ncbi:Vacuolar protein sorting-associated protein 32 like 1 [Apostasia shenzhenica]|uniref:Vacuolar protein sorting-associated protein 32 like 1 n=1 Tax=Apostasia shenzhenica TaxID=1088818 RepID=A0A2I0B014_9ASPA|nr:Vacuolar protein sorting-associated protein 32 like 1 [Apostasia shenzhenica]
MSRPSSRRFRREQEQKQPTVAAAGKQRRRRKKEEEEKKEEERESYFRICLTINGRCCIRDHGIWCEVPHVAAKKWLMDDSTSASSSRKLQKNVSAVSAEVCLAVIVNNRSGLRRSLPRFVAFEKLEEKEFVLQKKIAVEIERAKEFTKIKNKQAALQCLKRKKFYEDQIEQLGSFQLLIHDQEQKLMYKLPVKYDHLQQITGNVRENFGTAPAALCTQMSILLFEDGFRHHGRRILNSRFTKCCYIVEQITEKSGRRITRIRGGRSVRNCIGGARVDICGGALALSAVGARGRAQAIREQTPCA